MVFIYVGCLNEIMSQTDAVLGRHLTDNDIQIVYINLYISIRIVSISGAFNKLTCVRA